MTKRKRWTLAGATLLTAALGAFLRWPPPEPGPPPEFVRLQEGMTFEEAERAIGLRARFVTERRFGDVDAKWRFREWMIDASFDRDGGLRSKRLWEVGDGDSLLQKMLGRLVR